MLTSKEKQVLDYFIALYYQNSNIVVDHSEFINDISGNELNLIIENLNRKQYIKLKKDITGNSRISLTYNGLNYKEKELREKSNKSSTVNNFNAPIHNSAIGNTGNITINIGITYEEMRSLINSKDIENSDKEVALKLVDYLETLTENNAPLNKGFLSKFSDVIAKHSWLFTLVGNTLTKYFIG